MGETMDLDAIRARVDPAWIAQQREIGWPDMHPEDFCHRCGDRNPAGWYADRETWLIATKAWAEETGREGICCPTCLVEMYAQATGKFTPWRFSPHVDSDMLAINRERERDEDRAEVERLRELLSLSQDAERSLHTRLALTEAEVAP